MRLLHKTVKGILYHSKIYFYQKFSLELESKDKDLIWKMRFWYDLIQTKRPIYSCPRWSIWLGYQTLTLVGRVQSPDAEFLHNSRLMENNFPLLKIFWSSLVLLFAAFNIADLNLLKQLENWGRKMSCMKTKTDNI